MVNRRGIVEQLEGGDLRSLGDARTVERAVLADPSLFNEVFGAMSSADPRIRMRAADVVEKVTRTAPERLQPFKKHLLHRIARIPQQEVRWHVAQLFPRLELTSKERKRVSAMLFTWIESEKSHIVQVMSLQALADFARQDDPVRERLLPLLGRFSRQGSPAVRSRSAKLLRELR